MNTKFSRHEIRSAIIGMTLGDSYLHQAHRRPNVRMKFTHCPKQMAYGYWKKTVIEQLTPKPVRVYNRVAKLTNGKSYEQIAFESISHPLFKRIRKLTYLDKKKTVTERLLAYLTPLGLAIWYMDDGSINITKRDGKLRGRQIFLHAACSEAEADVIRNYFLSTWGIEWKKLRVKQGSENFSLRANCENAIKFFQIISQYVHPSMRYKIDLQYHNNTGRNYQRVQQRIAGLKELGLYFKPEDIVPTTTNADNLVNRAA